MKPDIKFWFEGDDAPTEGTADSIALFRITESGEEVVFDTEIQSGTRLRMEIRFREAPDGRGADGYKAR